MHEKKLKIENEAFLKKIIKEKIKEGEFQTKSLIKHIHKRKKLPCHRRCAKRIYRQNRLWYNYMMISMYN